MARTKHSVTTPAKGKFRSVQKKFAMSRPPTTSTGAARPKPHRFRPGTRALMDVRKLQRSTDLLMRRLPFARLVSTIDGTFVFFFSTSRRFSFFFFLHQVRELTVQFQPDLRWQGLALEALQEAAEAFLVSVFEDTYGTRVHTSHGRAGNS